MKKRNFQYENKQKHDEVWNKITGNSSRSSYQKQMLWNKTKIQSCSVNRGKILKIQNKDSRNQVLLTKIE